LRQRFNKFLPPLFISLTSFSSTSYTVQILLHFWHFSLTHLFFPTSEDLTGPPFWDINTYYQHLSMWQLLCLNNPATKIYGFVRTSQETHYVSATSPAG
jgi:hypothetical protein